MREESGRKEGDRPAVGEVFREVLRGIRSEILLYGIVVIVIIVGSARFGLNVLHELEIPLLLFATFVLAVYFVLNWTWARERLIARKPGK
jgi:hypothetical protein